MAIIKTYPLKTNYYGPDRLILSDMQPDDQGVVHGTTKSLTLSSLKSFIGSGSAPLILTTTGTSGAATFDVNTNILNVPVYEGDTYNLRALQKSSNSVPLKLNAASGTDSEVNFTEGANITLTRNSDTEITISATGGNAGVGSITNAFGTYISGTTNTAATGAVGLGTIDLNATNGTSTATTRFLSKDNTWDVISASGSDTQIQYNNNGAFGGTTGLTWDDSTNVLSIGTRFEGDINGALLQQVIVKEVGGVSKGDIVYISGGTGDNPEVKKALANASITMPALGIMKANTAENETGESITSGEITGLGSLLNGISTGDELFVSNTTAGGFQTSAPTGEANLIQKIGKVIKGGNGGALTVLGAFRTNATPNLNQGSLFIGNVSNQSTILGIGGNNTVLTSNGTTATWVTPTDTNSTYSLGTGASPGQIVLTGSNPTTSQTVTVAGTSGISITQFTAGTFNVDLGLATSSTRGGVKIGYTESGKNYPVELSNEQAYVNVPWTDTNTTNITLTTNGTSGAASWNGTTLNIPQYSSGSGGGISFSGSTVGGLATFTNSSTAGVSSKVNLNANGLMDFDYDGNSAGSIDFDPTGTRLKIGDLSGGNSGIVEIFTNGNRQFQIGVNGEIGLGTGGSQGTSGQVLTSGGNGTAPTWTAKTIVPSNVVTGAGNIYEVPMWNPQNGVSGSYIGAGNGFNSSPFKSNSSGQSIISTEINGGITLRQGSGAQVKIEGSTGSGGAYQINLPQAVAASTNRVLGVNSVSGSLMTTAWVDPGDLTSITGTTAVNSSTFANTPFTFESTSATSGSGAPFATKVASSFGNKHISFYFGTTFSGAINQSGTNTVNYATSSDYRLKENVVEMTGAVDRLKQLKPSKFNFIADGPSRTVDGFLAHEVSNIVPEAITGSKDAIDAEGNIIPQSIDQSKLVPLLVGAIKELTARIEALEA